MASIRRTLTPVPRTGAMQNGEAHLVSSPLSKSSSCSQNHSPSGGLLSSFFRSIDSCSVLCKIQAVVLGTFSQRSSRSLERSKAKGQAWKRAFLHFFISFMIGILIGLTPFVSMNLSVNFVSMHQAFSFKVIPSNGNAYIYNISAGKSESLIKSSSIKDNASLDVPVRKQLLNGFPDNSSFTEQPNQDPEFVHRKLLIIVTPTYRHPLQAYYLNRLMHTLKLVQPPLLWIVVEMSFQSAETADILRRSGVMYRHLVCDLNATSIRDRGVQQRNVALSHIETHRLDGIIHFADDDNVYSVDLLEQMREIRRFGTWTVATLTESRNKAIFKGPVCNGSQVIGWHTNERIGRFRRFHADMSGFAFNSTILWDPKRWHRPTLEPVRQLDTIKEGFQESTFVEQLVEDESQMEGLLNDCSKVMVWHLHLEALHNFYPFGWFMKNYLDAVTPLG